MPLVDCSLPTTSLRLSLELIPQVEGQNSRVESVAFDESNRSARLETGPVRVAYARAERFMNSKMVHGGGGGGRIRRESHAYRSSLGYHHS